MIPLTAEHVALANRLAQIQRGVYRHATLDDLRSDAYLGLVQAAHRYRPDTGTSFETFAYRRIVGAMQDGERTRRAAQGWTRTACVTAQARQFVPIRDQDHAVTMRIEDAITRRQRRRWLRSLPLTPQQSAFVHRTATAASMADTVSGVDPSRAWHHFKSVVRIGRLAAGLSTCLLLATTAYAQNVIRSGETSYFAFEHNGVGTREYVVQFGNVVVATLPVTRLESGSVVFPITVTAVGDLGQATSTPIQVQILPPLLGPCPYVTAAGVASPKSIGERFRGSLSWTLGNFTSEQAAQDRRTQLESWGLRYFEVDRGVGFTRGWFQCVGSPAP